MQTFNFSAINEHGQKISGMVTASSRELALQNLKLRCLQPINLRQKKLLGLIEISLTHGP